MTDLAVIGAGTMGAWTAFHGVRAGWATALVDAYLVEAGALWIARRDDGFETDSFATLGTLGVPVERRY